MSPPTLSLLQSQLLLVTGMSRLRVRNSSLKKQMSEPSLVSLYWHEAEAVVEAGCPGFITWLELRLTSRPHPEVRRTQQVPNPAAQEPSARAPAIPWHSEVETQVPVNLSQEEDIHCQSRLSIYFLYYPVDGPIQGLLGKYVTCSGLKSLALLTSWRSHSIGFVRKSMFRNCNKIIWFLDVNTASVGDGLVIVFLCANWKPFNLSVFVTFNF